MPVFFSSKLTFLFSSRNLGFSPLGDFSCSWIAVSHIIFLMLIKLGWILSLLDAFWYFWKFSRDIPVDSYDLRGSCLRLCRATIFFLRTSQFTQLFLTPTSTLQTKHFLRWPRFPSFCIMVTIPLTFFFWGKYRAIKSHGAERSVLPCLSPRPHLRGRLRGQTRNLSLSTRCSG